LQLVLLHRLHHDRTALERLDECPEDEREPLPDRLVEVG
jgi:hypothetical protein